MFKYTRASIDLIIADIKKYIKIFKYGSLCFTSIYFIYVLIMRIGNYIANIILASLFVAYTLFELLTINKGIKTVKRIVKRSYKWIKIIIKAFTLGLIIYGIYNTTNNVSAISIVLLTLMIILWILQVILELIIEIIENKVELVIAGWNKDVEDMKKPITLAKNVIKKIKGQEVEVPTKSKEILLLEKQIENKKAKKKRKHSLV